MDNEDSNHTDDLLKDIECIEDIEDHDSQLAEVIDRLIQTDRLEQAYEVALKLRIPVERGFTLLKVVEYLSGASRLKHQFASIIRDVRDAVAQMSEYWQKADALCAVALAQVHLGEQGAAKLTFDEAVNYARHGEEIGPLQSSIDCAKALKRIVQSLVQVGEIDTAHVVALSIGNDFIRTQAINLINKETGS